LLCFDGNKLIKYIVPKHNGMGSTEKQFWQEENLFIFDALGDPF